MDNYSEILLQRCKKHQGPVVIVILVQQCGYDEKKSFLRQDVAFKKVMHPGDAKERPALYNMNYLTHEELLENLTILMDTDSTNLEEEKVLFPTEEEIIDQVLDVSTYANVASDRDDADSAPDGTISYTYLQSLAVVWDEGDNRYWCVAFFLSKCDDEETFEVDNLVEKKNSNRRYWVRPVMDDVQDVLPQFIIPCVVQGEWDVVENVEEIEKHSKDFDVVL